MIRPLVSRLVFLVGVALWVPGWALFNVSGAWGMQLVLLPALLLSGLMVLLWLGAGPAVRSGMTIERSSFIGSYLVMLIVCTVFSAVNLVKSAQTFAVEIIGLQFSATLAWWLCKGPEFSARLLDGFRWAGLIASAYAIYQVVGWRFGLPLTYIPMNNASFILEDPASAQYLQRALAATPEPSVLACLLLPLLAMTTVDVIIQGEPRHYAACGVVGLALLATGSQSLAVVPFFLLGLVVFVRFLSGSLRRSRKSDIAWLGLMTAAVVVLLAANVSILESLGRLGDRAGNVSAAMRFSDILIGLEMFREQPLTGFGLGSSGAVTEDIMGKLGLSMSSGGITSGLLRVMAEQGLVGLAALLAGVVCVLPRRLPRGVSSEQASLLAYQAAFVVGAALTGAVFVGYRNMYQLWLIVPVGLSLKQQLRQIQSESAPPTLPAPVRNARMAHDG